jgi:hypothetical protein
MRKYQNSFIVFLLLGIGALLFFGNRKEPDTPEKKLFSISEQQK